VYQSAMINILLIVTHLTLLKILKLEKQIGLNLSSSVPSVISVVAHAKAKINGISHQSLVRPKTLININAQVAPKH
jgi:hypothetical protein